MSDEIKQIAALIGHHQALEKRVSTLTEEFQAASVQLQRQSETLSKVIRELDSASGNMTDTVRKSVSSAMNQVTQALTQAGTEQQKPAVNALNQVVKAANDSVNAMRREMYRYTWKSAIYLVLTIFFVLACCVTALTWFMNDGYSRIAEMGVSLDIENYCTLRLIFVQPIINGALVPQLRKAAVCQIQNPVCRGYGFRAMGYQQDRKPQLT